jgi:hypothetical protein
MMSAGNVRMPASMMRLRLCDNAIPQATGLKKPYEASACLVVTGSLEAVTRKISRIILLYQANRLAFAANAIASRV